MKLICSSGAVVALTMVLFVVLSSPVHAGIVYGATFTGSSTSTLYTVDSTTGVATAVAPITIGGTSVGVTALAFNPLNGLLYGSAQDPTSPNNSEIFTLNVHSPNPGVATVVGAFGVSAPSTTPTSLAFSSNGSLYAYFKQTLSPNNESLFSVNAATGAATPIGPSGLAASGGTSGNGMAMSADGTLYFTPKTASGAIYTLNTTTGAATAGATLNNALLGTDQIKGLSFDGLGTLYGIEFNNTTKASTIVTIDPISGHITIVGSTVAGLTSLAFEPAAVPEPGSLCLVGAMALGYFARRKFAARRSVA